MPKAKLTQRFADTLLLRDRGQTIYWDTQVQGFGLLIGKTSKTYIAQKNIHGKTKRVTIGKHGVYAPETARKIAQEHLVKMSLGHDPTKEKRDARIQGKTVATIFEEYMRDRRNNISESTETNYRNIFRLYLHTLKDKPLRAITTDIVIQHHRNLTETAGKYSANHTLKFLKTLYSYAQIDDEDLRNPVDVLKRKKLWHIRTRRTRIIKQRELAAWYKAVSNLQNQTIKDCLRLLVFTGLRKTEAFTLRWENVDFEERTFLIPHTKNGKSLTLPMSSYVYDLLQRRYQSKGNEVWVFPGGGKYGHLTEMKSSCKNISKECGVDFSPHDLRRTFITIAETVAPSQYALKRLINHSISGDVTGGYIIVDLERLGEIVQTVSKRMQDIIGI